LREIIRKLSKPEIFTHTHTQYGHIKLYVRKLDETGRGEHNKEGKRSLERRKNKGKKEKGGKRGMNKIKILALLRTLLDLINPTVVKQNQVFFSSRPKCLYHNRSFSVFVSVRLLIALKTSLEI